MLSPQLPVPRHDRLMLQSIHINAQDPSEVFNLEYNGGCMLHGTIRCRVPLTVLARIGFTNSSIPRFESVFEPFWKDSWSPEVRDQVFTAMKTMISKWIGTDTFDLRLTEMSNEIWKESRYPVVLEYYGIR